MSTTPNVTDWRLVDLQDHLKMAIDLEFWTIPFYRVAYHAAGSGNATAQGLINDVSKQEMFHCQCAWNMAQAFGVTDYDFTTRGFSYEGTTIPHLDFALDDPNPATTAVTINGTSYNFTSYSAALNPSTFAERINAMCLVEFPDWQAPDSQELKPDISSYPSIGHFYAAIQTLMNETTPQAFKDGTLVSDAISGGGSTQTGLFGSNMPSGYSQTVSDNGTTGLSQVNTLINTIVEEGEGTSSASTSVPAEYQFDGDADPHFNSFLKIYSEGITQQTMASDGVDKIMDGLTTFLSAVQTMFEAGGNSSDFMGAMYSFDDTIADQFS